MKKTITKIASLIMLAITFTLVSTSCQKGHNNPPPKMSEADSMLAFSKCANPIPDLLKVPAANKLVLFSYGKGVQIYEVQRSSTDPNTFVWVNTAPLATIFARPDFTNKLANHFAGPTWEFTDGPSKGEKVVATKLQAVTKDAAAIPWLLLKAVDSLSLNNKVTYIQRLCTEGGLAPATGADEKHLGQQVSVPYTASYLFYEGTY